MAAGKYDRRIEIELATESRDAARDVVRTWAPAFKLWAQKRELSTRELTGAGQVIREGDAEWTVRWSSQAEAISAALHRIVWNGRVYEITGIQEGAGRRTDIKFLTAFRPDLRGARAKQ